MGWADTRKKARRVVHSTFSLPAVYTAPGGGAGVACLARKHSKTMVFGDLDREQYAQMIADVDQVVFDELEVVPVRGGIVDFGDAGKFRIEEVLPKTDDFRRCNVVESK